MLGVVLKITHAYRLWQFFIFFLSVIFLSFERSITRLSYKDIEMGQRNEVYQAFCGAKVTASDQKRVNPTQQIQGLGDTQHPMCTLY